MSLLIQYTLLKCITYLFRSELHLNFAISKPSNFVRIHNFAIVRIFFLRTQHILTDVLILTVSPSIQTVNGKIRMYHPAQNPATGKAMKIKIKNQMICHKTLPPAAIFDKILISSRWKLLKLSADNRRKTTPSSVSDWRTAKP